MRTVLWMVFSISAVTHGRRAKASPPVCNDRAAQQAEVVASSAATWDELYDAYRKYRRCDDGSIGEAFSDSVGLLLSKHEGALHKLWGIAAKDSGFRRFVVMHVDETIPADTLTIIQENVKNHCPPAARKMCRELLRASQ